MPSECWEWQASFGNSGYGQFDCGLAHRAAYRLLVGKIPDGLVVLHSCDNKKCVNPSHLHLGTQKDNIRDASSKGRMIGNRVRGSKKPGTVLNEKKVRELRKLRDDGWTFTKLALHYGCAVSTIRNAYIGKWWSDVK